MKCVALLVGMVLGCASFQVARADEDAVIKLFDGKSLEGWHGDPELWKVEDGAIVGSTDDKTLEKNSFLSTKDKYRDFVLKVQFKIRDGNSGVQFRSEQLDDYVVHGYQADIATERYLGILYEEGKRGILADVDPEEVLKHLKKDDWNEYVITVDGSHIKQELNGHTTIEYEEKDPEAPGEGIIALQLHAGPGMKVWFREIELKKLP